MIFSSGHGRYKSVTELKRELKEHEIKVLIDVRTKPYSRWQPVFNRTVLHGAIDPVEYIWMGDVLGGLGPPITDEAIDNLIRLARKQKILIMCSEGNPDKCHRHHIIARRLHGKGVKVLHLTVDGVKRAEEIGFHSDSPKPKHGSLF